MVAAGGALEARRRECVVNQLSEGDPDAAALFLRLLHQNVDHVELGIDANISTATAVPFQLADRTRLVRLSRTGPHGKAVAKPEAIAGKVEIVVADARARPD